MRGGALKQAALRDAGDHYESEADMTGDSDSDVDADESKSALWQETEETRKTCC